MDLIKGSVIIVNWEVDVLSNLVRVIIDLDQVSITVQLYKVEITLLWLWHWIIREKNELFLLQFTPPHKQTSDVSGWWTIILEGDTN